MINKISGDMHQHSVKVHGAFTWVPTLTSIKYTFGPKQLCSNECTLASKANSIESIYRGGLDEH